MSQSLRDLQKENLTVQIAPERTYLILIATHKEDKLNTVVRICCSRGIPIEGYVYDSQLDSYCITCYDYLLLGYIPISFTLELKSSCWKQKIPIAESVIENIITPSQRKEVDRFRSTFKIEECSFEYVQMIDPN